MVRVAPADVRTILDTEVTDLALEFAIDSANAMLAETLVGGTDQPSDDTLALLERWLAAHFIAAADPQAEQVQVGDVRVTYEGSDAASAGLSSTRYGRRAVSLDPTGELDAVGKPAAMFETFGHDASDY